MRPAPDIVLTVLVVASLAACGGDDTPAAAGSTTGTTVPAVVVATSGETSATTVPSTTGGSSPDEPMVTAPATELVNDAPTPTDATCPESAAVGTAYGAEVEFDEADATTGAIGLVFCPYTEVLGPGTTNAFGEEAFPDEFSITLTDQNPVVPGESGEELDGVGQAATWSEALGELAVWTGERGVIVSITFPPPGDALTTAIALAQLVM